MFAPKIVRPQTKATEGSTRKLAPRRPTIAARPFSGSAAEQAGILQRSIGSHAILRLLSQRGFDPTGKAYGGCLEQDADAAALATQAKSSFLSWNFSKIPRFPPDQTNRTQAQSPRAHLPLSRMIQSKLAIGRVNDPLEHEADQVADRVMSMPAPVLPIAAAPPQISRKCTACQEDEAGILQTKGTDAPAVGAGAPESVHAVLGSSGQRLDLATRAFLEPRFGHNFARVRVHADARAAASAAEVGARAYAVGEDIVFGAGEYAPWSPEGRRLLAHELVHVVQQGSGHRDLRRAPCRSAAQCATTQSGDPGHFSGDATTAEATKTAVLNAAPPGSHDAALKARTGEPAIHVVNLLNKNGIAIRPEVAGFFVNPNIDTKVVGAQTNLCQFFPGGSPGTPPAPADKMCVQVPAEMEDTAKGLDIAGSLSASQRDTLATEVLSTAVHEMQHATFNTAQEAPASRTITAALDCSLDTIVTPPDINVEFLLSEISAITAEFPVFFENTAKSPHAVQNLDAEERQQAFDPDEGLVGAIKGLQCHCSCTTVDSFVTQTVNLTTASWAPATRLAFLKAMTGWMPSFWPKALQQK